MKLGVFLSNSKSRRAKLTADKLAALAGPGPEWAAARRWRTDRTPGVLGGPGSFAAPGQHHRAPGPTRT